MKIVEFLMLTLAQTPRVRSGEWNLVYFLKTHRKTFQNHQNWVPPPYFLDTPPPLLDTPPTPPWVPPPPLGQFWTPFWTDFRRFSLRFRKK